MSLAYNQAITVLLEAASLSACKQQAQTANLMLRAGAKCSRYKHAQRQVNIWPSKLVLEEVSLQGCWRCPYGQRDLAEAHDGVSTLRLVHPLEQLRCEICQGNLHYCAWTVL